MANIKIEDLEEDQHLDTLAMRAIFGGRAGMASSTMSMKYAAATTLMESQLVPGLIQVTDLRNMSLEQQPG